MTRIDNPLLSFAQAREEACATCSSSMCCRLLNVESLRLDTLLDLDYALYLLNFEGIVLSLMSEMTRAEVFFHQSCSKLDPQGLCSVHGTTEQPSICVDYRSHDCGYKKAFMDDQSAEQPMVDRARLAWLASQMVFDDERKIVERPFWPDVIDAFKEMPVARSEAPPPSPGLNVRFASKQELDQDRPHHFSEPGIGRPCQSCAAYCCKSLEFPRFAPTTLKEVDFLRYCLGFPSVEVKVTDGPWAVIVHTNCRQLQGDLCAVYGTDERPIRCDTYDEFRCAYKPYMSRAHPEKALRIRLEEFPALAGSLLFDGRGKVRYIPPIDTIRQAIEPASSE
jgi:hypothetical protein